jgi:hypothetical protein
MQLGDRDAQKRPFHDEGPNRYKRPRPCENPANFCKQSRRAKFFAIFSLPSGLRARKSEQNRSVSKRVGVFTQARPSGSFLEILETDENTGQKIRTFYGPRTFCDQFMGRVQKVARINAPAAQVVWESGRAKAESRGLW